MSTKTESNKRIAKNTLLLYFRMLLTMIVSLYTSRVVLNTLGVDNYGIYNVVGGIVTMFTFINSSMASATQRFLTYELGCEENGNLHQIFNNSIFIHFIISLIVILFSETIGLWFLYNKMIIPLERMEAALWCYQFSIFSAVIMIMSVPYNAMIIAHEKMGAFAYISIIEVAFKLIIAYSIDFFDYDRLKYYAVFMFLVQLIIRIIYGQYCQRHFVESRFKIDFNRQRLKEMISFAGFDLYGNLSVTARTHGINVLLNMFFGPVLNAASGIAAQVQGAVVHFANNIIVAVRPQIIKSYSANDYNRVIYLIYKCSLITYILLLMLSIPIIIDTPYILGLWLGKVPDYTVIFCRLTLLFGMFANLSQVIMIGIHATGKIQRPSFINGSLYLSVIPISYVSYKLGASPEFAYFFNLCAVFLGIISNAWTLHLYLPSFSFCNYLKNVVIKAFLILMVFYGVLMLVYSSLNESFIRLLILCFISFVVALMTIYWILSLDERKEIIKKIMRRKSI